MSDESVPVVPEATNAASPEETKQYQVDMIKNSMEAVAESRSLLRKGFFPGQSAHKVAACIRFLEALHDQQKVHLKDLQSK